jgi:hypothetical protein
MGRTRTFVVIGSNIGLGLATAIHLPRMNPAHLILAVHDIKKRKATNNDNKYNIVTVSTGA